MSRVKTFDSTGIAPNGRLYAGDLNAIQDQYADIVNFAQTHGVSVLQIGDTAIQLLKFSANNARLTSVLRADGEILPGTFTTPQRNAFAAGSRPPGLIIYNSDTKCLEINLGSDATPKWFPSGPGNQLGFQSLTAIIDISTAFPEDIGSTITCECPGGEVLCEMFCPDFRMGNSTSQVTFHLWVEGADAGIVGEFENMKPAALSVRMGAIKLESRVSVTAGNRSFLFTADPDFGSTDTELRFGTGGAGVLRPGYTKISVP